VVDNLHSTMTRPRPAPIVSGVINKLTTVELCMSPVYRRLAVTALAKFLSPQCKNRRFCPIPPAFGAPVPVEFRGNLWHQKARVPGLSCGVVCVILRFAVLVELRLVADTDTDTDRRTEAHG